MSVMAVPGDPDTATGARMSVGGSEHQLMDAPSNNYVAYDYFGEVLK